MLLHTIANRNIMYIKFDIYILDGFMFYFTFLMQVIVCLYCFVFYFFG